MACVHTCACVRVQNVGIEENVGKFPCFTLSFSVLSCSECVHSYHQEQRLLLKNKVTQLRRCHMMAA